MPCVHQYIYIAILTITIAILFPLLIHSQDQKIALIGKDYPNLDNDVIVELKTILKENRFDFDVIGSKELSIKKQFNRNKYKLVIIPNGDTLPYYAVDNLLRFISEGGDILVFTENFASEFLLHTKSGWLNREKIIKQSVTSQKGGKLFNINDTLISQLYDCTPSPKDADIKKYIIKKNKTLKVEMKYIPDINEWSSVGFPKVDGCSDRNMLTTFYAKTENNLQDIIVEWKEKDGSRWIAPLTLDKELKQYILFPEDFKFWQSVTNRGGKYDVLNMRNAQNFYIGIARSHSLGLKKGKNSIIVSKIAVLKNKYPGKTIPIMETLYPWYKTGKFYNTDYTIKTSLNRKNKENSLSVNIDNMYICVPRAKGHYSYGPVRKSRFIPLLTAYKNDQLRGYPGSAYLNLEGRFKNSIWIRLGLIPKAKHIRQLKPSIIDAINLLNAPALIRNGGVQFPHYFIGERAKIGISLFKRLSDNNIEIIIKIEHMNKNLFYQERKYINTEEVKDQTIDFSITQKFADPGKYKIRILLKQDKNIIDQVYYSFTVSDSDKPVSEKEFVKVKGDNFYLNNKVWYPYGTAYYPNYYSGLEFEKFKLSWINPGTYDADITDYEFSVLKDLNLNFVMIGFSDGMPDTFKIRALHDMLYRLKSYDMKANIYLADYLFYFKTGFYKNVLKKAKFINNSTIWTFDIAWEPRFGSEWAKWSVAQLWTDWLINKFGTIVDAEEYFNVTFNMIGHYIAIPDINKFNDKKWDRVCKSFWRFADDFLNKRYRQIHNDIRSVDKNHLIHVRTGFGGNGSYFAFKDLAFDLFSGSKYLDFISPEGYYYCRYKGGIEKVILFTCLYSLYSGHNKPVYLAEFGKSHELDKKTTLPNVQNEQEIAQLYKSVVDKSLKCQTKGFANWWSQGGYRVEENSAFGFFNLDWSIAKCGYTYKESCPDDYSFKSSSDKEKVFVKIDRFDHVTGLYGLMNKRIDEVYKLYKKGKEVQLISKAHGMSSIDAPLELIGGGIYKGIGLLKYFNSEFIEVKVQDDINTLLQNGDKIAPADKLIFKTIKLGNMEEVKWSAKGSKNKYGAVVLEIRIDNRIVKTIPIPKYCVKYEEIELNNIILKQNLTSDSIIKMQMAIKGRDVRFGEIFYIYVK